MTPSSSVHGVAASLLVVLAGCGTGSEPALPAPPPSLAPSLSPAPDAAPVAPSGITELPTYDPSAGLHLDGKGREAPPPSKQRNRSGRMIGIMLRSSPPGAIAAVDGQPIGPTPTYWEGEFTGGEREFTFALAKHAVARYRFIPTTSGVVHGRLEPIADRPGAGTPAIPMPAPSSTPGGASSAVAPPSVPPSTPPSAPVTTPDTGGELSGNPYPGAAGSPAGSPAGAGDPAPTADGGAAPADAAVTAPAAPALPSAPVPAPSVAPSPSAPGATQAP